MSRVRASASIHEPRAAEMRLTASAESDALFLTVSDDHVWFCLNPSAGDLEAEAEAMDRLAELATEAAARLRSIAAARACSGEVTS